METFDLNSINWFIAYYQNKIIDYKNNGGFSIEYYKSELEFWKKELAETNKEQTKD